MVKKSIIFIFLFWFICTLVYSNDYWDYPAYLLKNTNSRIYSSPQAVVLDGSYFIFYLEKSGSKYLIKYLSTKDIKNFDGPFNPKIIINTKDGFIPEYSVAVYRNKLYLIWNTLDGALDLSIRYPDGRWTKPVKMPTGSTFCFKPTLFVLNDSIFITYHTETKGRSINFLIIKSDPGMKNFSSPEEISKGFAGSFFPYITYYSGRYYCFWQSRPFTEKKTPVFDIYLSISDDGVNWSFPKNLTGDLPGEKRLPIAIFRNSSIELFYESDREGTWGIYSRVYGLDGNAIGADKKLNRSLANTRDFRLLVLNDNIYLFYLDERDGKYKIYYQRLNEGSKEEYQLNTGNNEILKYAIIRDYKDIDVFYQDKDGLAWIGPDKTALPPELFPLSKNIIGKAGVEVRWKRPPDASGIEGYCYLFTDSEIEEPEIVNLPPEIEKLKLIGKEDGVFYFKIRSKDLAGNLSPTVSLKLEVDVTPPDAPKIIPYGVDKEGYFRDNKVIFKWETTSNDVDGFNYKITRTPVNLDDAKIRTKYREIVLKNLKGGIWYFNIASVDKAGNISSTVHYRFKLKALPPVKIAKQQATEKTSVSAPAIQWVISRETFKYSPVISIMLYLILGSLFGFIMISGYLLTREILSRRIGKMEEVATFLQVRKKKIGLRFKFSLLIVSLILVLTVGISTILSYVTINKEKKHLSSQMIDKAKITLENITNVAREGILNNDELLLVSVIAKTMENRDIKYTIILDNNNRVIAHSDITQKGKILNDEFTIEASKSKGILIKPKFNPEHLAQMYDFASPIIFANKRLGTVRLGYSTESIFKALEESRKDSLYSTIVVTIITIIIGIISAVLMATITIKPIKILAKGAYIIGSGNLDYKIHVKAKDEIGILADEFNRMTERLAKYQKELEKKAKLDEQIEIAKSIQQSLIPSTGINNEFVSIGGFYKAATGVGGDYYDYIMKNEKYSLIISDVAGKGVPASLMMTMIRTVFRSLINSGVIYPPRVVTLINNTLISDIASDRFATLLFGAYDHKKRIFQYTNAGYGPIMLFKQKKNECMLIEPKKSSIPIGVMPDVAYMEESPIKLNRGDALILFTDGIHEARNEREEEYGMERLAGIIPKVSKNDASQMANAIIEDVMNFVGNAEQFDDMTLLVLKVK